VADPLINAHLSALYDSMLEKNLVRPPSCADLTGHKLCARMKSPRCEHVPLNAAVMGMLGSLEQALALAV
jgi:hypothetical protein